MKRFLSLLLSISLLLSVNIGTMQVSANAEEATMINKSTTLIDMTGVEDYALVIVTGASKRRHIKWNNVENTSVTLYLNSNTSTVYADSETFPENTVIKIPQADLTYIQFATSVSRANSQKLSLSGKVYYTASGTPSWYRRPENVYADMTEALDANKWYNFEVSLDMTQDSDNMTITYTEILSSESSAEGAEPHIISDTFTTGESVSTFRHYPNAPSGAIVYYDDIKMIRHEAPYEKAKITSIGTEKVVEGGQNIIPVELSKEIPELSKDHITVTNTETNETVAVGSIIASDGETHTLDITLDSNLASWSSYELKIDALAFGEGSMQRVGEGELNEVTDIIDEFTTTTPPFAAKPFAFTKEGDNIIAEAMVVNTTGEPKDMSSVFVTFDREGNLKSIVPTEHTGFVNSSGEELEANVSISGADRFNFFVIDNWTDRNQTFGAKYNVDSSGESISLEAPSSCEELSGSTAVIELGELDYDSKKIIVKLDTKEGSLTDGILFIYKNGESLSSSNLPIYAEGISTAADGRLEKEITLPSSLTYGEYTFEFSSEALDDKVTNTFHYYSPEEIAANKKAAILADAKIQSDAQGLSEVLMGVNSAGEKVNDNFAIFGKDADLTAYKKATNKLNIFTRMLSSLSSLESYNDLVTLFVNSAKAQRTGEIAAQKLQIVDDAKASVNVSGLMKVILGIDDNENVINTNFEVISSSANLTVYNSLKNKAAVFNHLYKSLSNVSNFSDLITYFESAANTQKSKENTPSKPSSNNTSYGPTSVPMKETTPSTPQNQQGTAVSSSTFADMTGHWAQNYVEALYKRGIMKGYEDGSFRGENSITRAELAKTLVETFEIAAGDGKTFADVTSSSWYAQYVASAAASGIVNGFEDGSFGPDKQVTRQDAVLMLYRAMSIGRTLPIGYTFFTDDLDISEYASGAIRTLGDLGIVGGNDQKQFLPANSITRAEVATIICRAIDYIESH